MNLIFQRSEKLLSFEAYQEKDGFKTLECVLKKQPVEVLNEIIDSKVVGRGGAGFPLGIKMESVFKMQQEKKYVICNADEGEPGTFKDRELLSRNPLKVIEGMIIAAYAVGANEGYLYVRGEYDYLKPDILAAIDECKEKGYLGNNILNSPFNFDIHYRSGSGAYICGEETALIESIEGRSGDPRHKPPFTAESGLFGKPTLVNNVETLINLLPIMNLGADVYKSYGTKESYGTKLFSVSGCVESKGVYEVEFGTTIQELIDLCGGVKDDLNVKFVQIGGSSGVILPGSMLNMELSYEAFRSIGAGLGSGAIFVADDSVCMIDYLRATSKFFEHESCGKCTPCREGNRHISRIFDKMTKGQSSMKDIDILTKTCQAMSEASFCGLGQTAPTAIISALKYFKDEIVEHVEKSCKSGVCSFGGEQ